METVKSRKHPSAVIGWILIVLGFIFMLNQFDISIFEFIWPIAIMGVGIFLVVRWKRFHSDPSVGAIDDFKFLGDTVFKDYAGNINGAGITHVFGDIKINLSKTQMADGESFVNASTIFGDVDVLVSNDIDFHIDASCVLGDIVALDKKHDGLFQSASDQTPGFTTATNKLRLNISTIFGDIRIHQV